jgi:hypothetical protein
MGPLSDNNGQSWILAGDGLSAYDSKRTSRGRVSEVAFVTVRTRHSGKKPAPTTATPSAFTALT